MAAPQLKFLESDFIDAVLSAAEQLQINGVKEHQQRALIELLKGHDVFVNLPTGYGKSLIFHGAPLCKDFLNAKKGIHTPRSLAIVVSPVVALIEDQIQQLNRVEVHALHLYGVRDNLWDNKIKDIKDGKYSIIFASPEVLTSTDVKELLASSEVRDSICGIFVDECHCISKWYVKLCNVFILLVLFLYFVFSN